LIYLAIGSNLSGLNNETPIQNCNLVLDTIKKELSVKKKSSWYKSQPIPVSNQSWYVNGVIEVETEKDPLELLNFLIDLEKSFGRIRNKKNESRIIDLDIIDYNQKVLNINDKLIIPHPRMNERAFVLLPLYEINPFWTHPITNENISDLVNNVKNKQKIELIS